MPELLRLAAFTKDPKGGNPAGVWIGDAHPNEAEMQRIAADVGYSETAFLAPESSRGWRVRYFSPAIGARLPSPWQTPAVAINRCTSSARTTTCTWNPSPVHTN